MNHNLYYRFTTLAQELKSISTTKEFSVLDVGGGEGQLAAFIPEASYCLAEPTINGISGIDLPFAEHSFDYVVSCHALEHIPVKDRSGFLDQLLSKSRKGVILLNPFNFVTKDNSAEAAEQIILDITDAPWAKEHLECTLPKLEDVKVYAKDNGLKLTIKPSSTMTTSMACVFMDYFANKAGLRAELGEVHEFFNTNFKGILDNNEHPTVYIVIFGK